MNPYTPKEAAQRLCSIGEELKSHNVAPEEIEALRQVGERFLAHFTRLEGFRKGLHRWAEGFTC